MLKFAKSSVIDAPVQTVWEFHERPDILQVLTPPWQPVQIMRREGGLEVGAISEFCLWLGPIPVQWVSIHTECTPHQYFVDEQQTGPMAFWRHRHQFEGQGAQTRLTDSIDFAIPGGEPIEWILAEWVNARLADMFGYRHRMTQEHCQAKSRSTVSGL